MGNPINLTSSRAALALALLCACAPARRQQPGSEAVKGDFVACIPVHGGGGYMSFSGSTVACEDGRGLRLRELEGKLVDVRCASAGDDHLLHFAVERDDRTRSWLARLSRTCELRWLAAVPIPPSGLHAPDVEEGAFYTGSRTKLCAVSLQDGKTAWSAAVPAGFEAIHGPFAVDGRVFVDLARPGENLDPLVADPYVWPPRRVLELDARSGELLALATGDIPRACAETAAIEAARRHGTSQGIALEGTKAWAGPILDWNHMRRSGLTWPPREVVGARWVYWVAFALETPDRKYTEVYEVALDAAACIPIAERRPDSSE